MRRSRTIRWLAGAAIGGVVLAACGGGGGRGNNPQATATSGASASASAGGSSTMFGDLASPCGAGNAKGATGRGVTDTSISIVYGDDRGFPQSPGLNHEMGDAVKAFVKWCNDEGGINGRKIDGKFADAKVTEANNVVTNACKSAFALVGTGYALDSTAEQTRVGCNLLAVEGFSVSPEFANGPMQYQGVPNPADVTPASQFPQMAKLYPDKIKKAALYTTTLPTERSSEEKAIQVSKKFGWNWLPCTQVTNYSGEPDYKPFMQKLKDCGAQIVYTDQSPGPLLFNMLTAANQVGFKPIWLGDANLYSQDFATFNKKNIVNAFFSRQAFYPLEQADQVPAVKKFKDIVTADGGDVNQLGEQAASSFLLWATAAKACGSTLTTQCMINELSKVHSWTAGGLHAATDPGANLPPQCGMLLKLTGGTWAQAFPAKQATLDCSPSYRVTVTGAQVGVTLNKDRITTKYLSDKVIKPQT
jgi:ABC-type branched-subunit amino acid transport system substrate-binding protein